ncbi:hypothetical protein AAG906_015941 [Vitis piasezkii]
MAAAGKPSQQLNFIDAVQRLGVAYHFEEEIEEALGHTFKRFTDENGSFKECLIKDVEGMLGLYEAAHLRVQEEDILDEAIAFTTTHLRSLVEDLDCPLAAQLDFNQLQSLYKKELSHITRFRFLLKAAFFRDRAVETYLWIAVACFEPQYSYARRIQAKLLAIATVIDDMYDAYGTPEELELFTEAIERLPEYMKPCYQALLDAYKEIEEKENEERSCCVHYAKEAMKSAVRAYRNESKWFHREYVPTVEEYLSVALVTSDVTLFTIISFVGMGRRATKEIMKATSTIIRLMDDMASHEFEQQRGHAASSVECYMKQHGVSEQHAYQELNKQVENAWKDVNQGCLRPTAIQCISLCVFSILHAGDFMYGGVKIYSPMLEK